MLRRQRQQLEQVLVEEAPDATGAEPHARGRQVEELSDQTRVEMDRAVDALPIRRHGGGQVDGVDHGEGAVPPEFLPQAAAMQRVTRVAVAGGRERVRSRVVAMDAVVQALHARRHDPGGKHVGGQACVRVVAGVGRGEDVSDVIEGDRRGREDAGGAPLPDPLACRAGVRLGQGTGELDRVGAGRRGHGGGRGRRRGVHAPGRMHRGDPAPRRRLGSLPRNRRAQRRDGGEGPRRGRVEDGAQEQDALLRRIHQQQALATLIT
ncbi:MAG: hypothetical protein P1V36_04020, partial [Planctomycetota bacterium]|nr:hypothetical protein [Planctomycetota bacterium]